MAISFSVNCERAVLFPVKCDLDPPLPPSVRAFEKVVYNTFVKEAVKENLSTIQFAYRESGNCTGASLAIQHFINKHLDNPDWEAVQVFAMDFSKAFDLGRLELLSNKLNLLPLNTYIINWSHSFLYNRQKPPSVVEGGFEWPLLI